MAKALGGTQEIQQALVKAPTVQTLWVARLAIGLGIIVCALISLVGTSWDIQWHLFVGRDRTLIPPHIMMLTGITLGGLLALTAVCVETMVIRRKPQLAQYSTQFAGMFYGSLGTYIAGFAALDAAIAFPLDSYWHSLYGIDVALWTPFHVMILVGMGSMPLGAAFMLRSAGQLARTAGQRRGERISALSTCVALSLVLSIFTILLSDALTITNYLDLGLFKICLFPVLAGLLTTFILMTVQTAVRGRWSATTVILMYIVVGLIFTAFVPPATSYLVGVEHLQYRRALNAFAFVSILAVRLWPILPIVLAPIFDIVINRARRQQWSWSRLHWSSALLGLLACVPMTVFQLNAALGVMNRSGLIGTVVSLLLGLLGTYIGTTLGRQTGENIHQGDANQTASA
ncbi:hypothetical protein [Dictyobacter aurantiacus]|uniref:Uncharacterized protein n=1 Tax=Dictyobacter aurantiacus TaxID=1936993 RepID=A0A401ZFQ7_9CHLR|nr:hypothetical protein [Dictyobacter aurantiacus]GCE05633.1 hypothetical protein KDAU_29620 [Dictyobacter aurantiacus]